MAAPAAGSGGRSAASVSGRSGGAGASGAAGTTSTAGTGPSVATGDAAAALEGLRAHLAMPRASRSPLREQSFATTALSRAAAEEARKLLWDDYAADVRATRMAEVGATESRAVSLQAGGKQMRYYMTKRGNKPADGWSLFISMHGGGNAPAATNDQQWNNQIALAAQYKPTDAIWVAPRAPSNEWNMWFTPDIEALFERLVTNLIVLEGVNPNKVYINGYSAGGDAVYQLGPRMADHWAAAAMSAGHPNDASPLNLRNVPFAIHVGGNDTAFERNQKAAEWGMQLDKLHMADMQGYIVQWQVHAGKPHWMDLADGVSIPFVQMHTRNPVPSKIVWRQANVPHTRFYWLAVDSANAKQGALVRAEYAANTINITEVMNLPKVTVRVSDAMFDLDQPVKITQAGRELSAAVVPRTIAVLARTLEERGDPAMVFDGEVAVTF